ncbi:MAG TPA: hypothetical protein VH880_00460 [Anaeromyxobacteraceae bacterium]
MAEGATVAGRGRLERLSPWVLLAAAGAAWTTSFLGGFQFDDFRAVVGDPRVQSLGAWWRSMPGIRPLLKLSYAANHASGLGLAGFHAVNLAAHGAAALLAFALLRRLEARLGAARGERAGAAALLGALIFALHPVQVEAVTYVSGRSASLSGALALGSALAFVAGRDAGRPALHRVVSPLLLAASLCVKEVAVVLPAALLLLERARKGPAPWREALRATAPHWAVAVAAAAAMLAAAPYRAMAERSLALRPPLANLLTQAEASAWLAGQLVRLDRLNADPALPAVAAPTARSIAALAAVAAGAAAGAALLRRKPAAAAGALWFLLWLAPQGWVLPRPEPASERQLYLAILGPAWALGRWVAGRGRGAAPRLAAGLALAAGLGAATARRSLVYVDEVTFWSDVVRKAPGSARAHANLGHALALACRRAEAEASLALALALDPGQFRAAANLRLLREGALPDRGAPCAPAAPDPRR